MKRIYCFLMLMLCWSIGTSAFAVSNPTAIHDFHNNKHGVGTINYDMPTCPTSVCASIDYSTPPSGGKKQGLNLHSRLPDAGSNVVYETHPETDLDEKDEILKDDPQRYVGKLNPTTTIHYLDNANFQAGLGQATYVGIDKDVGKESLLVSGAPTGVYTFQAQAQYRADKSLNDDLPSTDPNYNHQPTNNPVSGTFIYGTDDKGFFREVQTEGYKPYSFSLPQEGSKTEEINLTYETNGGGTHGNSVDLGLNPGVINSAGYDDDYQNGTNYIYGLHARSHDTVNRAENLIVAGRQREGIAFDGSYTWKEKAALRLREAAAGGIALTSLGGTAVELGKGTETYQNSSKYIGDKYNKGVDYLTEVGTDIYGDNKYVQKTVDGVVDLTQEIANNQYVKQGANIAKIKAQEIKGGIQEFNKEHYLISINAGSVVSITDSASSLVGAGKVGKEGLKLAGKGITDFAQNKALKELESDLRANAAGLKNLNEARNLNTLKESIAEEKRIKQLEQKEKVLANIAESKKAREASNIDVNFVNERKIQDNLSINDYSKNHIINGNLNKKGVGSGGHYQRSGNIRIKDVVGEKDSNGVIKAYIQVRDPVTGKFIDKKAETSLFPESLSQRGVELSIESAFKNSMPKEFPNGSVGWEGRSSDGLLIQGYNDAAGGIATAWPVYGAKKK